MEKIGRTRVSLETREAFQDGHRLQIGARAFHLIVQREAVSSLISPASPVSMKSMSKHNSMHGRAERAGARGS
jgi:hypothetical protein